MNDIRKRRKYLVDRPVQFRFMGLVVLPLLVLSASLYYLIYYSVFSEILIPEAIVAMLLPAMKKVNIVVVIAAPILLFLILRAALIFSNRIVGPIPRIERELDRVIGGDYSVRLKVRNKDELTRFVNKINLVLEKLDRNR
ncbi:MAG: hypothetical protein PHP46_01830 [Candidatus Omnitrophica bacterium]|nr:hypothetical protein [Candidatus Omnitrophota bacterium]